MPNELPPKSNLVVVRNAQYRERYISPEQGYPIEPQVPKKPPLWFTILFQVLIIVFFNFAIPKTISLMFDFMDSPLTEEGRGMIVIITLFLNVLIIPGVVSLNFLVRTGDE